MKIFRILSSFAIALFLLPSLGFSADKPDVSAAVDGVKNGAIVVDVRTPEEYAQGHYDGAINIPHDSIGKNLKLIGEDKSKTVVVYCKSGRRAAIAKKTLENFGFTSVINGVSQKALEGESRE